MKLPRQHILALLLCALTLFGGQEKSPSAQTERQPSAGRSKNPVTMFLRLFDLLDSDGDGVVPLATVFDRLDLKQAEARQVKRARALDGNNDVQITRAEAIAGVQAEIEYQTKRRMNTDVDEDGEMTVDKSLITKYCVLIIMAWSAIWMNAAEGSNPIQRADGQQNQVATASNDKLFWHDNYQAALAEAKKTGKPIFLEFRCAP